MDGALRSTCEKIANRINDLGPFAGRVDMGPTGFVSAHQVVLDLLKIAPKGIKRRVVRNIALDMGVTWPLVKNNLILDPKVSDVQWHTLMMDNKSPEIKKLAGQAVSATTAANQEKGIRDCQEHLMHAEKERKVVFECKVYTDPPVFHGFLIDDHTLVLNMCNLKGGKLQSANNYMVFKNEPETEVATDYIAVFATWFDYKWQNSPRTIWPFTPIAGINEDLG